MLQSIERLLVRAENLALTPMPTQEELSFWLQNTSPAFKAAPRSGEVPTANGLV